jgi:hypothetical protein
MSRAEEVANAVLYEGYILYPYRPSSVKNQQRWNFGVVYPTGSSEGAATMETQCLAVVPLSGAPRELDVKLRFLHLIARTTGQLQSWQEGLEREIVFPSCSLDELRTHPLRREFTFPASRTTEFAVEGPIVREQELIQGAIEVSAENSGSSLLRITIRLVNLTPNQVQSTRDGALLRSFVSAHKILTLRGGEFVSLIDPPAAYSDLAEQCKNVGTFPVLAGEDGQRNVMLSSPIILYDYPQIAPESAGDLCDGTEIDEILSLRILTLTDEEKREMRQSDERGRRILERTETMPEEQWMKLHGVLRGLRPSSGVIQ